MAEAKYLVISGTNRNDSYTIKVATHYYRNLKSRGCDVSLMDLTDLPDTFLHPEMYDNRDPELLRLQDEYLIPATHFLLISPEYNGSYPGVLKLLIDGSDIKACWHHKKALLTGVSSGRAGNLRGMDHLTGVLHHVKMTVYHNCLPISSIEKLLDEQGAIHDADTLQVIDQQINGFLNL